MLSGKEGTPAPSSPQSSLLNIRNTLVDLKSHFPKFEQEASTILHLLIPTRYILLRGRDIKNLYNTLLKWARANRSAVLEKQLKELTDINKLTNKLPSDSAERTKMLIPNSVH